jgi:muramoyltetrapeptide carboxypeptidase
MSQTNIEVEVLTPQAIPKPLSISDGVLWGGNLSMISSLLGTEYLPSIDQVRGGILFIEDVNEHPYRIERMLHQLVDAGYLGQQKALLLGGISSYRLTEVDRGYDLNASLDAIRQRLGETVPILTGLPFGHNPDKLTLPVGRVASLSASSSGYILKADCA